MEFKEWLQLDEARRDPCYYKVKRRYKKWPSAYACVPVETSKALTRQGWKSYGQLEIGEEILTYNLSLDRLEFKPILNLHEYQDAETWLVQNGNTGFKFECTPNHKWVVRHPECKGKIRNCRKKYKDLINNMRLATTEEMLGCRRNTSLVISSKFSGGSPVSLEKIYKYQTNWIEYLLHCSPEQRESWLYSAIVYDGYQIKTQRLAAKTYNSVQECLYDTPHGKQSFSFKQKDINHRDAFLISAFLNQGIVTFKKHLNADIFSCHYVAYNGTKALQNFVKKDTRQAHVWCPETENGTWVMMQETDGNGIITVTGNSGALAKCRKVGVDNWGESQNESNEQETCSFCESPATSIEIWEEEVPVCDACSAGIQEGTFDLEKSRGLRGWFDRNRGKGWIDCRASRKGHLVPCGRKKAGRGTDRKYPACRPTLSACTTVGVKRKKSGETVSWKKDK